MNTGFNIVINRKDERELQMLELLIEPAQCNLHFHLFIFNLFVFPWKTKINRIHVHSFGGSARFYKMTCSYQYHMDFNYNN